MPSEYSNLTGDPEDYTLDNMEQELGRDVTDEDIRQLVVELTERRDFHLNAAINGPEARHLRQGPLLHRLKEKNQRLADSLSRRISYYQNLLDRWPT